ncbi:MAG: hypothetical protein A3I66_14040 [Burkholderiales bacterium RIFCSPLOWO2_02_FULL_57_36]|nr:MAG: hypothetical protein A3I66_14040 [Burkholderiales bacterium RIFCSPLOWO2_02_FULL_57_36]
MKPRNTGLGAYWIVPKERDGVPFGIGVTATDINDALHLIQEQHWNIALEHVSVQENVCFSDLDPMSFLTWGSRSCAVFGTHASTSAGVPVDNAITRSRRTPAALLCVIVK